MPYVTSEAQARALLQGVGRGQPPRRAFRVIRVSDLVHNILDITLPRLLDDAYDATQLTHFRRQAAALRTMAGVIGGNFRNRAYVVVRKIRFVASSARNHSMAAARLQQRLLDIRRRLSGLVEAPDMNLQRLCADCSYLINQIAGELLALLADAAFETVSIPFRFIFAKVIGDCSLVAKQRAFIIHAACALDKAMMVRLCEKSGNFYCTELGRIANHFYLQYSSVETYNEMLWHHMNESKVYISRALLDNSSLHSNAQSISRSLDHVMRTLFEICLRQRWSEMTSLLLEYCKGVDHKIWAVCNGPS
uniref:SEC63 domain-containing protein n=1 Tax=Oryza rufipogon TaxID=4529 RepID=A0A0E0NRM9_ORYRU